MAEKSTSPARSRKTGSSTSSARLAARPDQETIRLRAYQIWRENGSMPGRELENWLQAERELIPVVRGH
ncbi:MAG: DUF2934 domain-containing protein [Candidatus Krumholzibacteriia bacterium]